MVTTRLNSPQVDLNDDLYGGGDDTGDHGLLHPEDVLSGQGSSLLTSSLHLYDNQHDYDNLSSSHSLSSNAGYVYSSLFRLLRARILTCVFTSSLFFCFLLSSQFFHSSSVSVPPKIIPNYCFRQHYDIPPPKRGASYENINRRANKLHHRVIIPSSLHLWVPMIVPYLEIIPPSLGFTTNDFSIFGDHSSIDGAIFGYRFKRSR